MKILYAASEATPYIKTGGLGDVAGSLPPALCAAGADARLVLPAYPGVMERLAPVTPLDRLEIPGAPAPVALLGARPEGGPTAYLLDAPGLFDRPGPPYTDEAGRDYPDNARRFAVFARAVVAMALGQCDLDWRPELVHCNDWQTGLIPALLSQEWDRPATVFTIHNLAYQGIFDHETFRSLGLPDRLWSPHGLEFHHRLSFIKGGIAFADAVNTVSPTYAREILTPELGYGLEGLLRHREARLFGILNGIDTRVWDPATDPLIPAHYDAGALSGKLEDKLAVQRAFGLPESPDALLFAHIGRLVEQKGADLITAVLPEFIQHPDLQLLVLGSGEPGLEAALREAALGHPQRVGVHIGYDEARSHLLEAGADCFLMPSRFEPCGLNQMYSLRYGTLPIVHRTGGLADTVVDANGQALFEGRADGFVFDHPTPEGLWWAMQRAIDFHARPRIWWEKLMRTGMGQDFSWAASAGHYLDLYRFALDNPAPDPTRTTETRP